MNVVTYLIEELRSQGVNKIFLTYGSHIDPFVCALMNNNKILPIGCAHEAGAGFMAVGYGLANNCVGVAVSIGGPGLANMLPSLLSAKHDERPLLVITGDVATTHHQLPAFQNAGGNFMADLTLTQLFCKSATRINKPEELPKVLAESLALAQTLPCGPVHIQIPNDLFNQPISTTKQELSVNTCKAKCRLDKSFEDVARLLEHAEAPLIYLGGRVSHWLDNKQLQTWLQQMQVPVISTIYARGFLPEDSPVFIGSAGFAGTTHGNAALLHEQCDTLIIIGADLSERNFLNWHAAIFVAKRQIVLIDDKYDQAIVNRYPNMSSLPFPSGLTPPRKITKQFKQKRKMWLNALQNDFVSHHYLAKIQEFVGTTTQLFVDAGSAKALATKHWQANQANSIVMSENTGGMGWAMCAAIGAAMNKDEKPVIALVGDGSTRMLGMELSTAAQYNSPVLFLINNNKQQKSVYDRMENTTTRKKLNETHPDISWTMLANSLNIEAANVSSISALMSVIEDIWPISKPFLIDITMPEDE
ncbi:MAG: thiamine pyrophosphate-binding protein [Paraglaciecola sp.]|uniref:thiamine pyrophosphate-binding protein n=1 Tax=Paraglaciecola sp. TaxID=1920173 RepID=UPI003296F516